MKITSGDTVAENQPAGDRLDVDTDDHDDDESIDSLEKMLAALPAKVKRRLKALKKVQLETFNIEAKFFEEVHALECKYHKLYTPLFDTRNKIINGHYEPTDPECDWKSDDEDGDKNRQLESDDKKDENVPGVPDFWLTILKNVGMLSEMIQEYDEPILKHLTDITVKVNDNPMGFILEFHFSPNEYFTNPILTKEYYMKCAPEEDDPLSFEGPEIYKCKGCTIDWNEGKNVTLKTVKKKKRHKTRGVIKTIAKTVQNESIFNFFSPPPVPNDISEIDDDINDILTNDFEVGLYIRERIVPRAVLYFTGEGLSDEEYEEEEEEEEDDVDFDIS